MGSEYGSSDYMREAIAQLICILDKRAIGTNLVQKEGNFLTSAKGCIISMTIYLSV